MMKKTIIMFLGLSFLFFITHLSAKFNFVNQYSAINIIGTNSQLILNAPLTEFSGTLNLKDNATSTISGSSAANTVTFANGVLNTGLVSSVLKGVFDPTGTDAITLGNGDFMDVKSGTVVQAITILGASTATIVGQPKFASSITLTNTMSVLQLGITTELTQTISGEGTLYLLDDLSVGKNVQLPSIVVQNGKTLSFVGAGTQSIAVTNTTGGTIEFLGHTELTELWTLGTGLDVYIINGNGSILDLSSAGGITFNGTTLYINNIIIRGLQNANSLKGTGRIVMSNVTLNLAGHLTRSDGSYSFCGYPSKVITTGSAFTISGSGNEIVVDGTVVIYDQFSGSESPFRTTSDGQINCYNHGKIQSSTEGLNTHLTITSEQYTFDHNFDLTTTSTINVNTSYAPAIISGAGHYIQFPNTSGSFLNFISYAPATLTNIVLKDFNPAAITFATPAASLIFGDGVRIELGSSLTINTGNKAWAFEGNAEIDAHGSVLRINKSQGITITGSKTLTIKNAIIEMATIDGIKVLSDTATIALKNVTLVLQNVGFSFDKGSMTVAGNVVLTGGALQSFPSSRPMTTFELATKGSLTIGPNAMLTIDPNINFSYNVNGDEDPDWPTTKRHVVMSSSGSIILNGCILTCSDLGFALDSGNLIIKDRVTLIASAAVGAEAEFGGVLKVNLTAGAVLDVQGPLLYQEVEDSAVLVYGNTLKLRHQGMGFDIYTTSPTALDGATDYWSLMSDAFGGNNLPSDITSELRNQFYILPGITNFGTPNLANNTSLGAESFWGNPSMLGQPVRSGDMITLQDKVASDIQNINLSLCPGLFLYDGLHHTLTSDNVRIPIWYNGSASPYYVALAHNSFSLMSVMNRKIAFRIYKYGASVGDFIYNNDPVYFVFFKIGGPSQTTPADSWNSGSCWLLTYLSFDMSTTALYDSSTPDYNPAYTSLRSKNLPYFENIMNNLNKKIYDATWYYTPSMISELGTADAAWYSLWNVIKTENPMPNYEVLNTGQYFMYEYNELPHDFYDWPNDVENYQY